MFLQFQNGVAPLMLHACRYTNEREDVDLYHLKPIGRMTPLSPYNPLNRFNLLYVFLVQFPLVCVFETIVYPLRLAANPNSMYASQPQPQRRSPTRVQLAAGIKCRVTSTPSSVDTYRTCCANVPCLLASRQSCGTESTLKCKIVTNNARSIQNYS